MANTALNRTTVALLTNKSGGSLSYGDVVVLDNTNSKGVTTTTTGAISTRGIAVLIEPGGLANNATGTFAIGGYCPRVNLNTASTVGQFLKTHTVAGQATPHSSPQVEGDFGVALTASATCEATLFGSANPPAGSVTTAFTTIAVSGQSDVVADSAADTLTLAAGSGVTITTNAGTDTVTVAATASSGALTLVEAKTITSDTQSYTFSGLDGDTDGVYLLICRFVNGANTSLYTWQPNTVATNQASERLYVDNAGAANANLTTLQLSFGTANVHSFVTATIYARKVSNSIAVTRHYVAQFTTVGTTVTTGHYGGRWNETSTNITSIKVTGDQTDSLKNGSQLYLYKYAQS